LVSAFLFYLPWFWFLKFWKSKNIQFWSLQKASKNWRFSCDNPAKMSIQCHLTSSWILKKKYGYINRIDSQIFLKTMVMHWNPCYNLIFLTNIIIFLRITSCWFPFFYNCLTLVQTSNLESNREGQRELQLHMRIGLQLF
jgi:hypothetical protein